MIFSYCTNKKWLHVKININNWYLETRREASIKFYLSDTAVVVVDVVVVVVVVVAVVVVVVVVVDVVEKGKRIAAG